MRGSVLGREWNKAREKAISDSLKAILPFRETGFFPDENPIARAWFLSLSRGQTLTVEALHQMEQETSVFLELYERNPNESQMVAYSDSGMILIHEIGNPGNYFLLLKPELLADVYFSLSVNVSPSLLNPVSGVKKPQCGKFLRCCPGWGSPKA